MNRISRVYFAKMMFKEDLGDVGCETSVIYLFQLIMCLRWEAKQSFHPRGEGKYAGSLMHLCIFKSECIILKLIMQNFG